MFPGERQLARFLGSHVTVLIIIQTLSCATDIEVMRFPHLCFCVTLLIFIRFFSFGSLKGKHDFVKILLTINGLVLHSKFFLLKYVFLYSYLEFYTRKYKEKFFILFNETPM